MYPSMYPYSYSLLASLTEYGSLWSPSGTILKKTLKFKVFFFACRKVDVA